MKGPCKDCTVRHIGCHGKCGHYAKYRAATEAAAADHNRRYNADADRCIIEGKLHRIAINHRCGRGYHG